MQARCQCCEEWDQFLTDTYIEELDTVVRLCFKCYSKYKGLSPKKGNNLDGLIVVNRKYQGWKNPREE